MKNGIKTETDRKLTLQSLHKKSETPPKPLAPAAAHPQELASRSSMYGLSAQDTSIAKKISRSWRMKWSRCERGSVLPPSHKYGGIVVLALLFLCLSAAKYWIMSFHTICPQPSLKIHEWAIL